MSLNPNGQHPRGRPKDWMDYFRHVDSRRQSNFDSRLSDWKKEEEHIAGRRTKNQEIVPVGDM